MTRYARHTDCSHDNSKKARRQCRTHTNRVLTNAPVTELQQVARKVELPGRSSMIKDQLVEALSFNPTVRGSVN